MLIEVKDTRYFGRYLNSAQDEEGQVVYMRNPAVQDKEEHETYTTPSSCSTSSNPRTSPSTRSRAPLLLLSRCTACPIICSLHSALIK